MIIQINVENRRSHPKSEECPSKVHPADVVVNAENMTKAVSILDKCFKGKYHKKLKEQISLIEKTAQHLILVGENIGNEDLLVPEMFFVCLPLLGGGLACGEIYEGEFIWDGTLVV